MKAIRLRARFLTALSSHASHTSSGYSSLGRVGWTNSIPMADCSSFLVCTPALTTYSSGLSVSQNCAHVHHDLQQVLPVNDHTECIALPRHWGWAWPPATLRCTWGGVQADKAEGYQHLPQRAEEERAELFPGLCYFWQAFPCSWDNKR